MVVEPPAPATDNPDVKIEDTDERTEDSTGVLVEDIAVVVDNVLPSWYTFRRDGPPQYSVELSKSLREQICPLSVRMRKHRLNVPVQVIPQSVMAAETDPWPSVLPHQHWGSKC